MTLETLIQFAIVFLVGGIIFLAVYLRFASKGDISVQAVEAAVAHAVSLLQKHEAQAKVDAAAAVTAQAKRALAFKAMVDAASPPA